MGGNLKEKYLGKQRDLSEKAIRPPFPKIVKIDTCNICNYRCVFCPQSKQENKVGCIDSRLCMEIIKDAYDAGGRELCLSMTGEPLINPDLEKYIIFAKKLGYHYVFLNTNGYLLDFERAGKILEAGLDSIKLSVNSAKTSYQLIHGVDGFDRVIENIKNFDKLRKDGDYSCKLYISYVAVKQTLNEAESLREELLPYVDDMIVMNANSRGGSISEIEECLYAGEDEYSFRYPCSQLFNNVYVTAEGYMIICCQDFENLTVVADLRKESIGNAWNNEKFTNFRKRYLSHDMEGTLCRNCIYNTNEKVIPLTGKAAYYDINEQKEKDLFSRIQQLDRGINNG